MKAFVIKVGGEQKEVSPKNGSDFSLKELYSLIGCDCIEIVYLYDGRIMVVDESGLLNEKELNLTASQLYGSVIVGDVLVCNDNMIL